ncbi:homoserine o-acetyltransferase [Ceraceosorus bombacis]|uniref:Homoserine o-acetyltransferase n=1 Tax=Ceraceosorus bombacis TaxID=401625 RepID=A0A0P1BIH1_9BASI|nr:homoserine o-acetyltransferase [Ceraceosorus bombacis]
MAALRLTGGQLMRISSPLCTSTRSFASAGRRSKERQQYVCPATLSPLHTALSIAQRHLSTGPPSFPCVDANEARTAWLLSQGPSLTENESKAARLSSGDDGGPEPAYSPPKGYLTFSSEKSLKLDYGGELPRFDIAYETWGKLNEKKDNVVLLHTGLSASSHAASTSSNSAKGWWEAFIGPGKSIDTDRFFVICTNVLGGCYGSTGPSSPHPIDGKPYATRFPILTIFDMLRAQFRLLDHLGVQKLFASVGSSMGGMQSVAAAHMYPERVARVVSISGCARSAPASIALRYAQRSVLMADPNWNRGFYYDKGSLPPHTGMKLARQIATITYRSGPEWEQRFGRHRRVAASSPESTSSASARNAASFSTGSRRKEQDPALCPDFLIETYLDHQGESFCLKYDANSLIYISKAMDLFDMSDYALEELARRRKANVAAARESLDIGDETERASLDKFDQETSTIGEASQADETIVEPATQPSSPRRQHIHTLASPSAHAYLPALARGLKRLSDVPVLILGAQSDILFPVDQQRELAECLRINGNDRVRYYEIDAPHGHDSFLIDVANVGGVLDGFLRSS